MGISEVMYSYGLSLLSIILIIFIVYLQMKIRKNNIRQWCMLILTCSLISNISVMFQIVNISSLNTWQFFEAFAYIGEAILPICMFFAICYYIEPDFKFKTRYLSLFYIPIITILCMFTNSLHGLMFENYSVNYKECNYGYMFYVYIINMYLTYFLGFYMLLKNLRKTENRAWHQILIGAIIFCIPYFINILAILGVIETKTYITEVIQSIMSIVIIYIVFKYQILTELPVSLNTILNTISDSYIVINDKKKIIMYNKIFQNTFNLGKLNINGMDFEELIEYKEFDTIFDEDVEKIINLKNKKYKNSKVSFERNSVTLGKTLKYEAEIIDSKKKETLFLIFITETTEYVRNIQILKLNHDATIGKERLASLGQMIGGIAHNLKTPIFSIAGALEGLDDLVNEYDESIGDKNVLPQDHREIANDMLLWTDKIKDYLAYMTDVIKAIQVQTSNNSKSIDEKFKVKDLIKYINILMKYELTQNLIDLKMNILIDENKVISGNLNTLVQVLNNLISNSIQAYKNEENKIIELSLYQKDDNFYIEVKDMAGGIPKEIQNKLFKEMVTTKGKNGTGLGLFISYTNIKTEFNGNITFFSEEGVGTIFRVIIPEKKEKIM